MRRVSDTDEQLHLLEDACIAHFGPRERPDRSIYESSTMKARRSTGALMSALTLVGLGDVQALGGVATADVAMTVCKLLASCSRCGMGRPVVPAAAFDETIQWFDVSLDLCSKCFTERAVILRDIFANKTTDSNDDDFGSDRDSGRDFDDSIDQRSWGAVSAVGGGRAADPLDDVTLPLMMREECLHWIRRLVEQGVVRPLQIGPGAFQRELKGHSDIFSTLCYSPDGATIASGSVMGIVRMWGATTGDCRCLLKGHCRPVRSMAFSRDGTMLATAGGNNEVRLFDAASGKLLRVLRVGLGRSVAFSPDGTRLACAENTVTRLWDPASGECLRVFEGCRTVAYSPDGATIATGGDAGAVLLWNSASGARRRSLEGHGSGPVCIVAYSPDGASLVSSSWDCTVRLWDASSGQCRRVLGGFTHPVSAVAFSPDGASVMTAANEDKTIWVWEAVSGNCLRVMRDVGAVEAVAFSLDGASFAVTKNYRTVQLWDAPKLVLPNRQRTDLRLTCSCESPTNDVGAGMSEVAVDDVPDGGAAGHTSQPLIKRHRFESAAAFT